MSTISIMELEATINRCAKARPPIDYVLGPDLRALAGVYGEMIYRHAATLELESLTPKCREVVERWYRPQGVRVCQLEDKDGCEACQ